MDIREHAVAERTRGEEFESGGRDDGFVGQGLNSLLVVDDDYVAASAAAAVDSRESSGGNGARLLTLEESFSYFGLIISTLPPIAAILKISMRQPPELWASAFAAFITVIAGAFGYFSGKIAAQAFRAASAKSWTVMLLALPLIGISWGGVTGIAAGIFFFVFGAVFGSVAGAVVGAVAVPPFGIIYRLLSDENEMIERRRLLPVAFGIASVISALILGAR